MFGTETKRIEVGEPQRPGPAEQHKQLNLVTAAQKIDVKKRAIYMSLLMYFWCLQGAIIIAVIYNGYPQVAGLITVVVLVGNSPLFALFYLFAGDMRRYRSNSKDQQKSLSVAVKRHELSLQPAPPRKKVPEHWAIDYAWLLVTKQIASCSREEARKANVNDAMWNAARDYFINCGLAFEKTVSNKPSFSLRKFSNARDFINRIPDDPPKVINKIDNISKTAQLTTLAAIRDNKR